MTGTAKRERWTIVCFALIGVVSTLLYFTLLLLLADAIESTFLLAALCYLVSMVFNFIAQGLLTFRSARLTAAMAKRYALLQCTNLLLNSSMVTLLVDVLGFDLLPSQISVTIMIALFTYLASRNWVYS